MSIKHADFFISLVFILFCAFIDEFTCSGEGETSISRSLDLSIPAWRPLVQNPYNHQYYQHYHHQLQNNVPKSAHLISYAHLNPVNKDEIIEAAKHNAQTLKKYNELSQQPITSYSPYPYFTQTPGPLAKAISTTTFLNTNLVRQQQPLAAASNHIQSRLPFPGKSAALYSTKLNFLGKPEFSISLHQNSIHQTVATTPKIAGFTKEQNGRVNFHYHHPSFGMVPIYDTTTKRNPMFSSSVTPQSTTKVHPVMSKLQAHMALAAISQQNHHNKLKHTALPNIAIAGGDSSNEFSPPSQIVSNYANYESATRVPLWHHGSPVKSNNLPHYHTLNHNNVEFKQHIHNPDVITQQQILPSVHPSIITPFLEQVHLKQKEVAAAEQKQSFKQNHDSNSNENFSSNGGSFDIVNDVFSKHLVPPPPSTTASKVHFKKPDKAKFNLSMQSPLQDASRFNYNNVISTVTPSTPTAPSNTKIINNNDASRNRLSLFSSESSNIANEDKPNLFVNLNRSKDNPYKQHKLLHPAYSGNGLKKKLPFNHDKTFLPTPYKPMEEEKDDKIKIDFEPHHSYFTIEDAVTPHFPEIMKNDNKEGSDELEIITLRPLQIKPTRDYSGVTLSSLTHFDEQEQTPSTIESTSTKPRQKLRRKKPKPQTSPLPTTFTSTTTIQQEQQQHQQKLNEEEKIVKFIRTRGGSNSKSVSNIISHENDLKNRSRINGNNRLRTRPTIATPIDYDYTVKTLDDELRRSEVATTQVTTEGTTSTKANVDSSEVPDIVRHRVRLRYKNKLNTNAKAENSLLEGTNFKSKLADSQISDSENENVLIRQPDTDDEETTELNHLITENPFNEIKSSLKLPNLKLRNDSLTTSLPTAETIFSSSKPSSTVVTENDENILSQNKIVNRPRFSIKELKRKQYLTSSTAVASSTTILTSSTSSTTQKPDNQRFNRFRLNLNRRRNETTTTAITDSNEETELPRKRYSSTRFSTQSPSSSFFTTESIIQSTKRSILPKRTFPTRNFTKPLAIDSNNVIDTTIPKTTTTISTNRHNLRQRVQNYKKKDISNEITLPTPEDSIKNVNFETTFMHEQPSVATVTNSGTSTTTEVPTRETSIMKIAKTHTIKATTSDNNLVTEVDVSITNTNDSTDLIGSPSDYSQRVAELTISGNENSTFKSANIGLLSRRIPNYFTISTDDPILPIQAFFPQIKTNESN